VIIFLGHQKRINHGYYPEFYCPGIHLSKKSISSSANNLLIKGGVDSAMTMTPNQEGVKSCAVLRRIHVKNPYSKKSEHLFSRFCTYENLIRHMQSRTLVTLKQRYEGAFESIKVLILKAFEKGDFFAFAHLATNACSNRQRIVIVAL